MSEIVQKAEKLMELIEKCTTFFDNYAITYLKYLKKHLPKNVQINLQHYVVYRAIVDFMKKYGFVYLVRTYRPSASKLYFFKTDNNPLMSAIMNNKKHARLFKLVNEVLVEVKKNFAKW